MMINPIHIEKAAKATTLIDVRSATAILEYAKKNGFDSIQAAAICIRAGMHAGTAFGKCKAADAFQLLHDYQGREDKKRVPEKRIKKAAEWIKDAKQLRELAAYLEGRAAVVESGMATFPDDEYTITEGEDFPRAWKGDSNEHVNSDGTEEV